MCEKNNKFCIIGPTAIGKSDFAYKLARNIGACIISADAYQVYRYMNIGTAKPPINQLNGVPYHLVNTKNPDEDYSVFDFLNYTNNVVDEYKLTQQPIIICGGAGLFIHSFLYKYQFPNLNENKDYRNHLLERYRIEGAQKLWDELNAIDPHTAKKVHPNNKHHLIRNLEIYLNTKSPPSQLKVRQEIPRSDFKIIGLNTTKDRVIFNINERVDRMIKSGLIEEVQSLLQRGYSETLKSMKAIGYKEVIDFLNGKMNVEMLKDQIKENTIHFSKRQMTWFKRIPGVDWRNIG